MSLTLRSCSWSSTFYIINKTKNKILITYSLKPTEETSYALKDTIEFLKLSKNQDVDDEDLMTENVVSEFSKISENGIEKYNVTIDSNVALSGGERIHNFVFSRTEQRHQIFSNIIEMSVIRMDTKDTVILKPSLLAAFSRPFKRFDIALIFD